MDKILSKFMGEFLGTFIFVLVAIGSAGTVVSLSSDLDGLAILVIAIGHSIGILVGILMIGNLTGGHLNPAVTIAMLVSNKISLKISLIYIFAQSAGASLAVLIIHSFMWDINGLGVHNLSENISILDGFIIESILTAFLVIIIMFVVNDKNPLAPFAISLYVLVIHFVAINLTGASINPARSFAPALIHNEWTNHWLYWIAPIIGGILGAIIYTFLFGSKSDKKGFGKFNTK